jgi:hypothetical protein
MQHDLSFGEPQKRYEAHSEYIHPCIYCQSPRLFESKTQFHQIVKLYYTRRGNIMESLIGGEKRHFLPNYKHTKNRYI